ncbi:hypothetical protein K438DRAFT_1770093 [Mycena galopus ATCC 62051]|nr:hypothetical protein K438DRAFT_1770093 [Mycena galopus ATCC 62051]
MYTNNPRAERKFHESVNPSFCENVQHIVPEPFNNLPPFKPASTPINYFSSQTAIDSACDGIIEALASLPLTESLVISLVIKCTAATLDIIQDLCVNNRIESSGSGMSLYHPYEQVYCEDWTPNAAVHAEHQRRMVYAQFIFHGLEQRHRSIPRRKGQGSSFKRH